MTRRILAISGALRAGSTNTKLLREAARRFDNAEVEFADLRLPLYDGDLETEHGLPPEVERLIAATRAADAVMISTPEYNKNLPGVLKNALDWMSREKPMALDGKPVAIMSAAAGRAGGERSQFSLRHCLTPFGPRVLQGPEVMVANSSKAFDAEGRLTDAFASDLLDKLIAALEAEMARGRESPRG